MPIPGACEDTNLALLAPGLDGLNKRGSSSSRGGVVDEHECFRPGGCRCIRVCAGHERLNGGFFAAQSPN